MIAINDAGRELLGDVGFEAVGLKVAHLLRSPASEDLTGPGFHHCALVDGDAKFTCATKCVSEYTCLNLAPLEGSAFGEQHPADGRVRAHSAGALDVRVARNDAFALPTSAAENQMLDQMLGEPVLGPTEDQLEIRLHVLFCDDDPFQAKVMNLLASTNGYDLTHFANGADAIHALRHNDTMAQPFNLVLLDLNMQPMHGLDVLKHIRAFNTSINVIVITANEEDAMVKACILGGANSYIVKPVRDKDVRNMGHFAIEATKAEKLRRRSRVRNAIASVLTTRFAIAFMSLRALKAHGGLIPHEEARSRGLLVQCDTYEDVASFIRTHPTAFFSHQASAPLRVRARDVAPRCATADARATASVSQKPRVKPSWMMAVITATHRVQRLHGGGASRSRTAARQPLRPLTRAHAVPVAVVVARAPGPGRPAVPADGRREPPSLRN